ncbi:MULTISPECIES: hypothetical protein [unclassified Enterococcus]|uniref:hypothetical protein n=1 Tax=unclassified Enterococcus TaxID=2608891 RepID=UPI002476C78D|nr:MULTISPECIES: hypothetical protein [unclassified Enterococcus]
MVIDRNAYSKHGGEEPTTSYSLNEEEIAVYDKEVKTAIKTFLDKVYEEKYQ